MAPKRATALELWGKEFARAREDAGLSQSVLAKDAYLSQSLIGMWETGQRTPKSAVPPDARACAIFTGPFVIASFDEGNEAAYVDDQLRGRVVEHPEDIAALRRTFELIRGDALSGRQSTDLIREAMEQWKPE